MRIMPWFICGLVLLTGCKSSKTKLTGNSKRGLFLGDTKAPRSPDALARQRTSIPRQGVLAGQVIDQFDRRVGRAVVRIVPTDNSFSGKSAPIDYEKTTNEEGYFVISDLDASKSYQLIARSESGGRVFTGATIARPPDPRISIRLTSQTSVERESGPPITPPKQPSGPAASIDKPEPVEGSTGDHRPPPTSYPTPPSPAPVVPRRDGGLRLDRTVVIPPVSPKRTSESVPKRDLPVPSCQRVGRSIKSFALHDVHKRKWVYPRDVQGKLVLLDFWHTRCAHCFRAAPMLSKLQKEFGAHGLEVVGVACESDTSSTREQRVIQALSRYPMHYRILMSGYRSPNQPCPVQVQLGVSRFPTLILLDENGTIVWRSEGLSEQRYQELRREIYRRSKR